MTDPLRLALLPRAIWTWTAPPPEGKRVQVWVDASGHPIEIDVDVSDLTPLAVVPESSGAGLPPELEFDFRPIAMPRVTTPTMESVTLAALLVECKL